METQTSDDALFEQLAATLGTRPKYPEYNEQGYVIELDLSQLNITQFPEELRELTHLERLNLSGNQLTQIPPEELGQLSNLQHLDLHKNQLTHIPAELGQLSNLQHLDLHKNQLTHIPAELGQLSNLQHLDLYENQLTQIPPELGQLTSLQNLDLSSNQLTQIPPELGQLTNLQNLHLHKNQLTQIPPELGQLTNLQYMSLSKNPDLLTPPPEIVAQGTEAVLSLLQELSQERLFRYEAKLILVGEASMGKSSLLHAFRGETFDASLETTHGIEVGTLTLPHHPSLPDQSLLLNVWDFGGQDIYRATHQFFLTKRALYLVVWNVSLGEEQGKLDYWLNTIRMLASNVPVLLVATHSDELMSDLDIAHYRVDKIVEVLQVSNKTGAGIDELKQAVAKYAATLPLVGQPWLPSWIEVEQELLACPEYYVSTDAYMDLCMAKGIRATFAQSTLGSYLHDLGKILYFRDDATLSDTIILKPNWIAKAISLVLEDKGVQDRSGILVDADLSRIWAVDEHGQQYDPALYPLFLRLMERFDLCSQIDPQQLGEDETCYLVPQLLQPHPPSSLPRWTAKEMKAGKAHIAITYCLEFVPTGIMNWFIVRTHQYTCNMHWREGVVLAHQEHLARVELFPERKELRMEVWGAEPHTFFVILKETVDLILSRFEGLYIKQEVPCICHQQTGEAQPCSEVYRYEQDLVKRLNQGIETIQCRESFCNIGIRELLYGLRVSMDPLAQKTISNEIKEIIQQLVDIIVEQQDKLRSEVIAEQKNILQRLNAITDQQKWKESMPQRRSEVQQRNTSPQYKAKSKPDGRPSEPPNRLTRAWNWYKRQQPPKQKKSRKSKLGCIFKLGCVLFIIISFFVCVAVNMMISSVGAPQPSRVPKAPLSNPVPRQHLNSALSSTAGSTTNLLYDSASAGQIALITSQNNTYSSKTLAFSRLSGSEGNDNPLRMHY